MHVGDNVWEQILSVFVKHTLSKGTNKDKDGKWCVCGSGGLNDGDAFAYIHVAECSFTDHRREDLLLISQVLQYF